MNKQCRACGALVPNEARFCQKCGSSDLMVFDTEHTSVLDNGYIQYNAAPPIENQHNQFNSVPPVTNQNNQYQNAQYQNFQQAPQMQQNWQVPVPQNQPKKKKTGLIIGIVAGVLAFLVVIGIIVGISHQDDYYDDYNDYYDEYDNYDDFDAVEYTAGSFDGITYTNEWADIRFDLPEGFVNADETMYASAEDTNIDCGMYFIAEDTMSLIYISFEGLPAVPSCDEEGYLDLSMDVLKSQSEITYQIPDVYRAVTVAGHTYYVADSSFQNGAYEGVLSLYVRKIDNYMVGIGVIGVSAEANESLVNMITNAN